MSDDIFDEFVKNNKEKSYLKSDKEKTVVFENDYFVVKKVLCELSNSINSDKVKRIQLVHWKTKSREIIDLDFRIYVKSENKYGKGITLSLKDLDQIIKALEDLRKN